MNNMKYHKAKRIPAAFLVFLAVFLGSALKEASGQDCGWALSQARDALSGWIRVASGFHSNLDGNNTVSYRDLIRTWGAPNITGDPAYKLSVCALSAFIEEVDAWPGEKGREESLIDSVVQISGSEMLLGNEDFLEALDQEHTFSRESGKSDSFFFCHS